MSVSRSTSLQIIAFDSPFVKQYKGAPRTALLSQVNAGSCKRNTMKIDTIANMTYEFQCIQFPISLTLSSRDAVYGNERSTFQGNSGSWAMN